MLHDVAPGLLVGALALGALHGAEPGHGWPVAAAYAFDRANAWLAGLVAGLVIGVGHLVSSLAVVGAFFLLKSRLPVDGLSAPLSVGGVAIGSPIGVVAGVLLILLGVREYRGGGHGHSHGGGHAGDDSHSHDHHDHSHDDDRDHSHGLSAEGGLSGIAVSAFVLGFAHEEEFEIVAICAGSDHCLGLVLAYALTVVAVITALTLVLVAGYDRFEERMGRYADHFPTVSAVVLVGMGLGFALGVL